MLVELRDDELVLVLPPGESARFGLNDLEAALELRRTLDQAIARLSRLQVAARRSGAGR